MEADLVSLQSPMGLTGAPPIQSWWYALQVVANHERAVQRALARIGIEPYLPAYKDRSQWSDRIETIERPLFPGYLFARFDAEAAGAQVLSLDSVLRILGAGDNPIPVPEHEIEAVRLVIASGLPLHPCGPLKAGQVVRVTKGSMTGLQGTLVRTKEGSRLVVSLELLHRAVSVEMDQDWVVPVGPR